MDQELLLRTAREVDARRYGKYQGVVTDNQDPQQRGRLRLLVPSVYGEQHSGWAQPCFPFAGRGWGWFAVPEAGCRVWVEFEEGDPQRPIWTGGWPAEPADVPADAALPDPQVRLLQSMSGLQVMLDDRSGAEQLRLRHPAQAELCIDHQGSVELSDAAGAHLRLDAANGEVRVEDGQGNRITLGAAGIQLQDSQGNRIELGAQGIVLKATQLLIDAPSLLLGGQGGEPALKGQSLVSAFLAHIHPTPTGPSGPPVPTGGELAALSTGVWVR